jgi:predicted ester cyclase
MEWFIVHEGKIVQRWAARDAMTIARQVGMPAS